MIDDMSVQSVAAAYTKLVKQMRDQCIEPVAWVVSVQEHVSMNTFGEYVPGGFIAPLADRLIDDYTAYDRGDLCSELDRALGDLIERVLHRYMTREEAQVERRNSIGDFADTIIQRDKAHGKGGSA